MQAGQVPPITASDQQAWQQNIRIPEDEGGIELGRMLEALYRRAFLIIGLSCLMAGAGAYKAITDTPIYKSRFEILTESVTVETQVISTVTNSDAVIGSRPEGVTLDETKIKVLRSPEVLNPVLEELHSKYPHLTYEGLKYSLNIRVLGPNVLEVSFQHPNPTFVNDLLMVVSQSYLNYSLEDRKSDIQQGLDFVDEQLPELEGRVEFLQGQLQNLRQNYNLIDPATTGEQLAGHITTVQTQQLAIQSELHELRSLSSEMQTELAIKSPENLASSALMSSPRYQAILDQLQAIDSQIAKDSVLLLEESPEIKLLNEQRQNLLPLLRNEADRTAVALTTRIEEMEGRQQGLANTLTDFENRVKQLSVISRSYTDIERELHIATENLNQFLTRRDSLRIEIAQRQVPWRLLEPVTPPQPSTASTSRNVLLGAIVGFMLGCGAALALDTLSNVLHSPKEVKKITKLSLLGIIPRKRELSEFAPAITFVALDQTPSLEVETQGDLLGLSTPSISNPITGLLRWVLNGTPLAHWVRSPAGDLSRSAFAEAFQALAANVRLLDADNPVRSIVLTSSLAGEGKTVVAAYLAQAFARMNRRVLVVDTDLRRPQVHQRLGVANGPGLTDVLSGDIPIQSAIQASILDENLSVLTAGMLPPDPIRLISSHKMQDLMIYLRDQFDLVIYDAPPLGGLADAHLLGANSDGVLLVTGLGTLKQSVLEQSLYELSVANTPVLGAIANFAKESPAYPGNKGGDRYGSGDRADVAAAPPQAVLKELAPVGLNGTKFVHSDSLGNS